MRKIIGRLLLKAGLMLLPKSVKGSVVFAWSIIHNGHYYSLTCSCKEDDIDCIKNSVSSIRGTIDRTLMELNLFPRPEGYITNEMWEKIEKEDKVKESA